jgi:hypothetical protein
MEVTLAQDQYTALVESAHNWASLAANYASTITVMMYVQLALSVVIIGVLLGIIFTRRWF